MKAEYASGLLIKLKTASDLGLAMERKEQIMWIIKEAELLGTIREIPIDEKRSLVVFTTVSASAHTPIVVPYQDFARVWGENGKEYYNPTPSSQADILSVQDKPKALVPLHFITWAALKAINDQGEIGYQEFDVFDLMGEGRRYDKNRSFTLTDVSSEERKKILWQFWEEVARRMEAHNKILEEMYREGFLPKINQAISSWEIPEDLKEKLSATVFFNFGSLVDHTLPVGYYSRWREDGLGRGPQSNPNFHFHSVIYFIPEKIWDIIEKSDYEDKESLFNYVLTEINQLLLGGNIVWLSEEAEKNLSLKQKIPEIMMKQIDPYASIIFRRGGRRFLISKMQRLLEISGISGSVESFFHHTKKHRLGDNRFAEGIKIEISQEDFVKFITNFNIFLNELYQIWELVKQAVMIKKSNPNAYQEILAYLRKFNLPGAIFSLIDDLVPVGGELSFNSHKVFAPFAKKEIKGGSNYQGYNIPGIPGLGITFEFKKGKVFIYVSPIFGKKGLAEQVVGLPVERIEARS